MQLCKASALPLSYPVIPTFFKLTEHITSIHGYTLISGYSDEMALALGIVSFHYTNPAWQLLP